MIVFNRFSPFLHALKGKLETIWKRSRKAIFLSTSEAFLYGLLAPENDALKMTVLFTRQEMQGDTDDEGTEDSSDEADDRVHARGAVDHLFTF